MDHRLIEPMSLYVLIAGVLVIFIGLGLRQLESLQKTVPLWLWSGLAGVLIGASTAAITVHRVEAAAESDRHMPAPAPSPESQTGVVQSIPPGSAMMGAMGMGGGGGRGGNPAPRGRRELQSLVGKLELLTRGLRLNLDDSQRASLITALSGLDTDEEMTEAEAAEHIEAIKAVLGDANSELLTKFDLPRPVRLTTAAPPPDSPTGLITAPSSTGIVPSSSGGGSSQAGGLSANSTGQPQSTENPFKQDESGKRLRDLRDQIGGTGLH